MVVKKEVNVAIVRVVKKIAIAVKRAAPAATVLNAGINVLVVTVLLAKKTVTAVKKAVPVAIVLNAGVNVLAGINANVVVPARVNVIKIAPADAKKENLVLVPLANVGINVIATKQNVNANQKNAKKDAKLKNSFV